jgi:elongation factor Ts
MNIPIEMLKKLRQETMAGVSDCRQALEDAGGDYEKARKLLVTRGLEKAAKKEGKSVTEGVVEAYLHATGKVGVLVELRCETDFVARNDEFRKLAHEVALQIAAVNPKDVKALTASPYIRDAKVTIGDLVKTSVAKLGEHIEIGKFHRLELGQ